MSREIRFERTYGGGSCVDQFVAYGHTDKYTLCTESFLDGKSTALACMDLNPEQAKTLSAFMAGGQATVPQEAAPGLRYPSGWVADVIPDEDAAREYKAVDPTVAAPLIRAFPDAQLSTNFRLSQFRPGRDGYEFIRISPDLVAALETITAKLGGKRSLTVVSGYRPPDYNREVGGVSNSCHIDGLAADIDCDRLTTNQLYDICDEVIGIRGGVGWYPKSGFVHVDVRGYRARWSGV